MNRWLTLSASLALVVPTFVACGSDDDQGAYAGEQAGQACSTPEQCYPNVAQPLSGGDAVCMDRVTNGYCTHNCGSDADCCAVPGECRTGFPQVCAPFESTGAMFCFLSCEDEDVQSAGLTDSGAYCQRYAHPSFGCRSTGGGSRNRKVCLP